MKIDIENGQFYYDLSYQLSFFVVLAIYLIEGYKRKFPWSTWLLVILTTRLFVVIGSKFGAITSEDFRYFIDNLQFPATYNKNLIGAMLMGFAGIFISKQLLRIRYPILDAFAVAIPFGIAVQRIGCLMVGCCYGTATNLPWGIRYGIHTPAFINQYIHNQVSLYDSLTLSIHPIAIYFIIASLLTGTVLIILRHRFKSPGNLTLLGISILSAFRFVIEFFRDPNSNGSFQGNYFLGLKIVQIICLLTLLILSTIIILREKRFVKKASDIHANNPMLNASYLLVLSLLFYFTRNWYSYMEFQTILILIVPAAILVAYNLIASYYSMPLRISTILLMLLSVLLMSQTSPQKESTTYKTVRLGYINGDYTNYHSITYGSGCDAQTESQYFEQYYNLVGAGYSVVKKDTRKEIEYGINGFWGAKNETGLTTNIKNTDQILGVTPFFKIGYKWFGGGLGFSLGQLYLTPVSWLESGNVEMPQTGSKEYIIYPMLYARIGPERIAFVSYHMGDYFPSPFPLMEQYVELGSGFGQRNGFQIGIGAGINNNSILMKAKIPIMKVYVLEPTYVWNNVDREDHLENTANYQFSVSLHYKFGFK